MDEGGDVQPVQYCLIHQLISTPLRALMSRSAADRTLYSEVGASPQIGVRRPQVRDRVTPGWGDRSTVEPMFGADRMGRSQAKP